MADPTPLMPVVARLYTQNGYRRASTKAGPGESLVQLADAEAVIGTWRQRAELRQAAFNQAVGERDRIAAAARDVITALSTVTPGQAYAEAMTACAELQRALKSLA